MQSQSATLTRLELDQLTNFLTIDNVKSYVQLMLEFTTGNGVSKATMITNSDYEKYVISSDFICNLLYKFISGTKGKSIYEIAKKMMEQMNVKKLYEKIINVYPQLIVDNGNSFTITTNENAIHSKPVFNERIMASYLFCENLKPLLLEIFECNKGDSTIMTSFYYSMNFYYDFTEENVYDIFTFSTNNCSLKDIHDYFSNYSHYRNYVAHDYPNMIFSLNVLSEWIYDNYYEEGDNVELQRVLANGYLIDEIVRFL